MILSGDEIRKHLGKQIVIDPFDPAQLKTNGYDLRLHDELLTYGEVVLDMAQPQRTRQLKIPPKGLTLNANQLYLARTVEYTETHGLVPMIQGRSSAGRLGLFVKLAGGFGDVGFCGHWTLQIYAVQPVRIYPGVSICQITYHEVCGARGAYTGKYQNNSDIQPGLLYQELNPDARPKDPQMWLSFESDED